MVNEEFMTRLHNDMDVAKIIPTIQEKLRQNILTPHQAASEILETFFASREHHL